MCVQVSAVAYDNPIPGFQTNNTINLRLWAAKPDREFDLQAFNTGDYVQVSHGDCQLLFWMFACIVCPCMAALIILLSRRSLNSD